MRTLGIDLAAQPAKTAVCLIDWSSGEVEIERRPLCDDELVGRILRVDKTGIDAPFGWPDSFVRAINAHHAREAWSLDPSVSPDEARRPLRFRRTDLELTKQGATPLSVSSDRIGVTAMRCADLQHRIESHGVTIDRAGREGCVCEVYPAASLRAWGKVGTGLRSFEDSTGR